MNRRLLFLYGILIFVGLLVIPGSLSVGSENIQDIKQVDLSMKPQDSQLRTGTVQADMNFGKFPLYFIVNKGQVDQKAKFYAKASRYTLWLTKEGLVFDSVKQVETTHPAPPGHPSQEGNNKYLRDVSRLIFLNAKRNPKMAPVEETKLRVNYFKGNDKSKWHCNIPTSQAVLYKSLYKNIDLKIYGIEKQIEYDWMVKPGGNPEDIRFEYRNVKDTRLDDEGNLLIETEFGELVHKKPVSYQKRIAHRAGRRAYSAGVGAGLRACPEERIEVDVTFKKTGENTYGFEVGEYDKSRELIIDPMVLVYSTYLGGEGYDVSWGAQQLTPAGMYMWPERHWLLISLSWTSTRRMGAVLMSL